MFINVRVQISGGKGLQLKYTILHSIFHTQSSIIWGSLFFLNKRPSSFLWERKKETHTLDTFYVPALKVVTTLLLRIHCSEVISWSHVDTRYQKPVIFELRKKAKQNIYALLNIALSLRYCWYMVLTYFIPLPVKAIFATLFIFGFSFLRCSLIKEMFLCFAMIMGSGEPEWETRNMKV